MEFDWPDRTRLKAIFFVDLPSFIQFTHGVCQAMFGLLIIHRTSNVKQIDTFIMGHGSDRLRITFSLEYQNP